VYAWSIPTTLTTGSGYRLRVALESPTIVLRSTTKPFSLTARANDAEAAAYASTTATTYDRKVFFGGTRGTGAGGGVYSLSQSSYCQARYTSLPFSLHCSLGHSVSYGSNSYTFGHTGGVTFGSASDLSGEASSVKVWFRLSVPTLTFPLLGNSMFYKRLAGMTLISAQSFPNPTTNAGSDVLQLSLPLSKEVSNLVATATSGGFAAAANFFGSVTTLAYQTGALYNQIGAASQLFLRSRLDLRLWRVPCRC
jgi:hypothetical protein